MNNIGYKSFTSENSQDNSRGAAGTIKDVLKAGGKLGFNVVLESLKAGGFENYAKQQVIEGSKKVGSYVANSIADRIRDKLCGKQVDVSHNAVYPESYKSYVVAVHQSKSKSSEVSR